MDFKSALEAMKHGEAVKLPSWGGFWRWDADKRTIIIHTKDGKEMDIRETQRVEYTTLNILSDEWVIAGVENCPAFGGTARFSFGEAIKYVKRGMKVRREGWNGRNQHIELAVGIRYYSATDELPHRAYHEDIGSMAIAFCGTRGTQIGWLASQADMLAEDWVFCE
mgnify:FL=1